MKKILIIGNYGIDCKLNGQTARTRTITKTVKKMYNKYEIYTIDTGKISIKKVLKFIFLAIKSDKIIIMCARGSLVSIINVLNILHLLNKTCYIVIGGWLYDYCVNHPRLVKKLKHINCLFVQTDGLKNDLLKLNISSSVLPNYRIYDRNITLKEKNNKYVYYSRIREDKGILIAIDAINKIKNRVYLDIYGPIDDDFKEVFYEKIANNKYIKYCGILNDNNNIIETLSQYKCLIFPTFYDGEGYPGTILESMTAGVPVIATDWKYNTEIINNNNGFIIKIKSVEDLTNIINKIENNKIDLNIVSKNCINESKKYTEKKAIEILKEKIGE